MDEEETEEKAIALTDGQRAAAKDIEQKLDEARRLVNECTKIADEAKVAFSVSMFKFRNDYVPEGADLTIDGDEAYREYDYDGWQSSGC